LAATEGDCEGGGVDWALERRGSEGDYLHDEPRRSSFNILFSDRSRAAFPVALFGGINQGTGGSDHRRSPESAFTGTVTQSGGRGCLGARNALALRYDAGVGWTISTEWAPRFSPSPRDVVCLVNPTTRLCSRTSWRS